MCGLCFCVFDVMAHKDGRPLRSVSGISGSTTTSDTSSAFTSSTGVLNL